MQTFAYYSSAPSLKLDSLVLAETAIISIGQMLSTIPRATTILRKAILKRL